MFVDTIAFVGMGLIFAGICIYALSQTAKLAKLDKKLENIAESFEGHTHCLSCGALNNRCTCK